MPTKLMAVLGRCRRQGRWEVSGKTSAMVLFGHCFIDYRDAYADDELDKMNINVICLFGNVTFIMPEGAEVRPSVVSLLASTDFDVPQSDAESHLPTMIIESTTLFGRCKVKVMEVEEELEETADETVELIGQPAPVPSTSPVDASEATPEELVAMIGSASDGSPSPSASAPADKAA